MMRHGGDIYRNTVRYDFSVNVNPLGMPASCREAAKRGVDLSEHYPDVSCDALKSKIIESKMTQSCQLSQEQIIIGNGAAELIYSLGRALNPENVAVFAPAFTEYARAAELAGARLSYVLLRETDDFNISIGRAVKELEAQAPELVFICNPNNPTGTLYSPDYMLELADWCDRHNSHLVVDECFLPFCEDEDELTMLSHIKEKNSLIILGAFTKIYAMAGLRLGYAICADSAIAGKIREQLQPWNVSIPAMHAGLAALNETTFVEETRHFIKREKEVLVNKLKQIASESDIIEKVYPSEADFVLFKGKRGIKQSLLEKGILIRECGDFYGLDDSFYRVAVRPEAEREKLIEAMRDI